MAALPSESGLTEAQEDFIDYWLPQRVIDDCQAKRVLIARTFDHQRFEGLAEDQRVSWTIFSVTRVGQTNCRLTAD